MSRRNSIRARTDWQVALLPVALVLLGGCAAGPKSSGSDSLAGIDHSGRMRGYIESKRVTDFCPDQASRRDDERCVVTRGFDYSRGVTIVRTYDPNGVLIATQEPPGADVSLTDVERARVEALVRSDPRISDIVNAPDVVLWHGGFVMREPGDKYCDRGSRCIRVIAAIHGGDDVILHSVVDLMTDRVVYPKYVPSGKNVARHSDGG